MLVSSSISFSGGNIGIAPWGFFEAWIDFRVCDEMFQQKKHTIRTEETSNQIPDLSCSSRCIKTTKSTRFSNKKHHQIYFEMHQKQQLHLKNTTGEPLTHSAWRVQRLPPSRWGGSFHGLVTVWASQVHRFLVGTSPKFLLELPPGIPTKPPYLEDHPS